MLGFYYKIISDNNHGRSGRGTAAHQDLQGDQLLRGRNLQAGLCGADVEWTSGQPHSHHRPGSSLALEDHQTDPDDLRLSAQGQNDLHCSLPQKYFSHQVEATSEQGFKSLWRGNGAHLWMQGWQAAVQIFLFDTIKSTFSEFAFEMQNEPIVEMPISSLDFSSKE